MADDPVVPECFIGGLGFSNPVLLSIGSNATWPLARLTLDADGLTIALRGSAGRPFSWVGFDASPVRIPYDELVRVERLRVRCGLRFYTQTKAERGRSWDRRNGTTFFWLPGHGRRVLTRLAEHGVEVS
jgi:hypothetical protein